MIIRKTLVLKNINRCQFFSFHNLQSKSREVGFVIHNNKQMDSCRKKKQFNSIKQNNFFEFFKKFGKKPKKMTDPESSSKTEDWFETEESLIFQDKKYPILKVQNTEKNIMKIYEYGLLLPLTLYTGYKFGFSLITLRPLKSIMWGGFFLFFARLLRGINTNKYLFILGIDLLDDGKSCLVTTAKEQMIIDVKSIRRLNQEEAVYYSHMLVQNNLEYIPIIIKKDVFLIFKNSSIFNREIFSAITSGKYIKVKEENLINKEDAIDIK